MITTMNSINVLPLLVSKLAGVKTRVSYSLSTSHPSEPTTLVKQLLRIFGKVGATEYAANSILAGEWLYGKGADFTIIPNTVDTEVFHYDQNLRETIRANLGLTSEIILGHIGRFEKQKNHEFLVSIFEEFHRRVEDSKLILVGWGSQRDRIFELIREKNLLDSVIYLGDTEDIVGLYNAFDCFILPSLYEGLPVVGIEAQACGCPCVFADTITRETSATESTIYISLKAPFSQWCEEILTLTQRTREDTTTQIVDSGFDLVSATHRFEHYLESLVIAS
ncbi:MAG: glycosyltransferase [Ancrocorticia sp.]|nr:glycosyltransferase [Ancrocorticia sp.]MCI2003030.1 glycosyltransferase [Ancrocorticia sp.]